jgi:hypothetical protein
MMAISQNSLKTKIVLAFAVLAATVLSSVIFGQKKAEAFYPSVPIINANQYLEVSRSGNGNGLNAPALYLRVYFKTSNGGTITVWDGDHCPYSNGGVDTNTPVPTRFISYRADANENLVNIFQPVSQVPNAVNQNLINFAGTPMCGMRNVAVNGLTRSNEHPSYFVAILLVTHDGPVNGGGVNAFKVSAANADASAARVGYYGEAGITNNPGDPGVSRSFFALQDRVSGNSTYSNFNFDFAPPCDYGTRTGYLKWRDDDWQTLQYNNNFNSKLYEYDRVSGIELSVTDVPPRGGNLAYSEQAITFKSSSRYLWVWENVIKTNGIQIYMPFSSMGASVSCAQKGEVKPDCAVGIKGYAFDDDRLDLPVNVGVTFYQNEDPKKPTAMPLRTANIAIPSGLSVTAAQLAAFGIVNKGFIEPIPDSFRNGATHSFLVAAYNIPGTKGAASNIIGGGQFNCTGSGGGNDFELKPSGSLNFDDEENPSNYTANVNVIGDSPYTISDVKVTANYTVTRSGTAEPTINGIDVTRTISPTGPTTLIPDDTKGISGLVTGDTVCMTITLSPGKGKISSTNVTSETQNVTSSPICDTVVNKPYVSFYSNDLAAGYGFDDTVSGTCIEDNGPVNPISRPYPGQVIAFNRNSGAGYQGSSSQLAIKALGLITGVNSGSTNSPTNPSLLSFANTPAKVAPVFGGEFGSSAQCIRDYLDNFDPSSATHQGGPFAPFGNSVTAASAPGRQKFTYNGDLVINRTNAIPEGSRWTIYVNGNVTIKNNIEYENEGSGWSDKSKIPALYLIVRGNISIASNVTQLDGIYIAQPKKETNGAVAPDPISGRIFTCTDDTGTPIPLANLYSTCNQQLKIYGSFLAQRVHLDRTFKSLRDGGVGDSAYGSDAAELFVSSPEVYLAEPNLKPSEFEDTVDYITTLPPIL